MSSFAMNVPGKSPSVHKPCNSQQKETWWVKYDTCSLGGNGLRENALAKCAKNDGRWVFDAFWDSREARGYDCGHSQSNYRGNNHNDVCNKIRNSAPGLEYEALGCDRNRDWGTYKVNYKISCCSAGLNDPGTMLGSTETLLSGASLFNSDKSCSATMQVDGNLVVFCDGWEKWATNTNCAGASVSFEPNGNLVLKKPDGGLCWASKAGQDGSAKHVLVLEDGGSLTVYSSNRKLWSTNTRR